MKVSAALILIAAAGLTALAGLSNGADMYRWVDEKGVVNYTPYPPPANIRKVEPRKLGDSTSKAAAADVPYSVQLATKNFPVTFYSTQACGDPCKTARGHLTKRGIPYTEKDPSNPSSPQEFEDFKKMTGGNPTVPLLIVGQLKMITGYLASDWDSALDAAGYPSTATPGSKPAVKPPADAAPAAK
jgi:glutaredoxin